MGKIHGSNVVKRVIAVMIIAVFFVTSVRCDAAVPVDTGFMTEGARFDPLTFDLPEDIGVVRRRYSGSSGKTVIHIQDAHCDLGVQDNIAGTVGLLRDRYAVDMVNLEGGAGEYSLDMFTDIKPGPEREFVTEYFRRAGLITGAELFHIRNPRQVTLWGIEDKHLYMENLGVYRDTISVRKEIRADIAELKAFAEKLKEAVYNRDLADLEAKTRDHISGSVSSVEHIKSLFSEAEKLGVETSGYRKLNKLLAVADKGEKIDFEKASEEREQLISWLEEVLSLKEVEDMESVITAYGEGRIDRRDLYAYLVSKAGEAGSVFGSDMERFRQFLDYGDYMLAYDPSDSDAVTAEIRDLESGIREKLFVTTEERTIDRFSRSIDMLSDIAGLGVTHAGYRAFLANRQGYSVETVRSFLEKTARGESVSRPSALARSAYIDKVIDRIARYYSVSIKREKAFIENLRFGRGKMTVLITGGFHTDGITRMLEESSISYVSIMPSRGKTRSLANNYHSILSGDIDPVIAAVLPRGSTMQIPNIGSEIAEEILGDVSRATVFLCALQRMLVESEAPVVIVCDDGMRVRFRLSGNNVLCDRVEANGPADTVLLASDIRGRFGAGHDAERTFSPGGGRDPGGIMVEDGLKKLFGELRGLACSAFGKIPRIAVVPDLHGVKENLDIALRNIERKRMDEIIFLGDYMDRGRKGIAVMRRLMELKKQKGERVKFLLGNHDMLFIMAMMGDMESFLKWISNGGLQVLEEARISIPEVKQLQRLLGQASPGVDQMLCASGGSSSLNERLRKLHGKVRKNRDLIEISQWMKSNCELYCLRPNGGLYLHAQVPMDRNGNISLEIESAGTRYTGIVALAKLEQEMKQGFLEGGDGAPYLHLLAKGRMPGDPEDTTRDTRRSPLWVREAEDSTGTGYGIIDGVLRGRERHLLDQLGAAFIVSGHTPVRGGEDLISLDNRVFFIDRPYSEPGRVVLFSDDRGMSYTRLQGDPFTSLADTDEFRKVWQEGRDRAAGLLRTLSGKSPEGTVSGSDLMGRLYKDSELLNMADSVQAQLTHSGSVVPVNAENGERLYDKYGKVVGEISVPEHDTPRLAALRMLVIENLKFFKSALSIGETAEAAVRDRVFAGAMDIISGSSLAFLGDNDHGVVGITDTSGERPVIYLNRLFAEDIDVLTVALFHEAAGIFLSRHPELVPDGGTAHEFLRGASKGSRRADPEGYTSGIQDEIFGELNEDLSYYAEAAQKDFVYTSEARFLAAVDLMVGGEASGVEEILDGTTEIDKEKLPRLLERYLSLREAYDNALRARSENSGTRALSADPLNRAIIGINRRIARRPDLIELYTEGADCAMKTLAEDRAGEVLDKLRRSPGRKIRIIPSSRQRQLELLRKTISANMENDSQDGAVADLPDGREIMIVGDLHGRLDNLKKILSADGNLAKIRKGEAVLLILGDAVHNDIDHSRSLSRNEEVRRLEDMTSSVRIMRFIQRLKRESPENVFYTPGNHDFLNEHITKKGVLQGAFYRLALTSMFGFEYVEAYREFLSTCPIMARTKDGLSAVHAGPIKSARSLEEIRRLEFDDNTADRAEPGYSRLFYEATWPRWYDDRDSYTDMDVSKFLHVVGARMLVTSHTWENIPETCFHAELMEGEHYVTYAARDTTGYLSYLSGRIEPVFVCAEAAQCINDDTTTRLSLIADPDASTPREDGRRRVRALEGPLGGFFVQEWCWDDRSGPAFRVTRDDGQDVVVKIPGAPFAQTSYSRGSLAERRTSMKQHDLPLAALAVYLRDRIDLVDVMPDVLDYGIHGEDPYIVTRTLPGFERLSNGVIEYLGPRNVVGQLARIYTAFQSVGATLTDLRMRNFIRIGSRIMLLDTGSCVVDKKRIDWAVSGPVEKMGISLDPLQSVEERQYEDFKQRILKRVLTGIDPLLPERAEKAIELADIMDQSRRERQVHELYSASRSVAENIRERGRPVVVLLQKPDGPDNGLFGLSRDFERELKRRYSAENLKILFYDGSNQGLLEALGQVENITSRERARTVIYAPENLELDATVKDAPGTTVIREDCPQGDMISMVGPHVVFALGVVNYREGNASRDLLDYLTMLLRFMTDDHDTLMFLHESGIALFLDHLIRGEKAIRMKKVDFRELRGAVQAQRQAMTAL